jgi:hypothetical protein
VLHSGNFRERNAPNQLPSSTRREEIHRPITNSHPHHQADGGSTYPDNSVVCIGDISSCSMHAEIRAEHGVRRLFSFAHDFREGQRLTP